MTSTARRCLLVLLPLLLLFALPADAQDDTRLLRHPAVSEAHVAFAYANDLWIMERGATDARRLTSFPGQEEFPHFSPDGTMIAFTGEYDGNTDVFVVPVEGGEPQRLTWHPGGDQVQGWTPDGRVLFTSGRDGAPVPLPRFWTVGLDGQMPEALPIPRGTMGEVSPDGTHIAYQFPYFFDPEWRNYGGGQALPLRIVDLETLDMQKLPWEGSRQVDPVWLGETVYFLSERDLVMNVYAYDTQTDELRQITSYDTYDVKRLDAGGGVLVYEQGGRLHQYDPATDTAAPLTITVRGDLPWSRPQWEDVSDNIQHATLSPTGQRALIEARGEIFTVPAEKGDWRNLTESSGAADRAPAWSPDGSQIAWFSDASDEYQLMIADQKGLDAPRAIDLPGPTFYYTPAWSPEGTHILFTDTDLNLWVLEVES
ncbi:MAG: protease, partial [Bacteroidetes bacterium]|nr:protease [Bacteroidota bacterium]